MGQPYKARRRADEKPKAARGDVRVLDFVAAKLRRDFVATADALPGGRKSLGRGAWRAKNASKGTYTPGAVELRALVRDAEALVAAGCQDEAALLRLVFDALLPVLRAQHERAPLPPSWSLHCAETIAQGEQDRAVDRFHETGTEADREAAMAATIREAAAAFRLYLRLYLDSSRATLGEPVPPLPAHVTALIAQVRDDGGAA